MNIPLNRGDLPYLTTAQMREVDRLMIEEFHIELLQMMENAGRNLAHLARVRFLDGNPDSKQVVILAGSGGNGGGVLVCARRLLNWRAEVKVYLTKPEDTLTPATSHQLEILKQMQVPVAQAKNLNNLNSIDLIIDGIIGYSLSGAPEGAASQMIGWANEQDVPVLSLDVPSGVDATEGKIYDEAVRATATMALALPKIGLKDPNVKDVMGELYLADIGVPPQLYNRINLDISVGPIFARSDIIQIETG